MSMVGERGRRGCYCLIDRGWELFLFGKWSHTYVRKMIEMSKSELKSCFGSDTVDADFVVTSVLGNERESTQTMMPAKLGALLGNQAVLRSMGESGRGSCVGQAVWAEPF